MHIQSTDERRVGALEGYINEYLEVDDARAQQ